MSLSPIWHESGKTNGKPDVGLTLSLKILALGRAWLGEINLGTTIPLSYPVYILKLKFIPG